MAESAFDLHIEIARAAAKKTDAPTVLFDVGEVLAITGWFESGSA